MKRKSNTRKQSQGRLLRLKKETIKDLSDDKLNHINGGGSCYNPPAEF